MHKIQHMVVHIDGQKRIHIDTFEAMNFCKAVNLLNEVHNSKQDSRLET